MTVKPRLRGSDLVSAVLEAVPLLKDPICAEGVVRLQLMAMGDYVACGSYYKYGRELDIQLIAGEMNPSSALNLTDAVNEVVERDMATGYYFIYNSDGDGIKTYAHYYIAL